MAHPKPEKHFLFYGGKKAPKITLLDVLILAVIAAGIGFFIYRVRVQLNYTWNWRVIPRYLVRVDSETGRPVANFLLEGFFTTLKLSIWASVLGLVIGTVMGLLRISRGRFLRLVARGYVELVRNIPPLVLVFLFYFFFSSRILTALGFDTAVYTAGAGTQGLLRILFAPPSRLSAFLSAVITLALYEGAYITEIVRSGLQSVGRGQWEAAYALGLSPYRRMRHVILPQAVRKILPPLGGQFISTIKDSAIVSVISIQELTFQGMELMSSTYLTFEVWLTVTGMYFVLTFICSAGIHRLETVLGQKIKD